MKEEDRVKGEKRSLEMFALPLPPEPIAPETVSGSTPNQMKEDKTPFGRELWFLCCRRWLVLHKYMSLFSLF